MDATRKQAIWNEIVAATRQENLQRQPAEYTVYEFIEQVRADGGPELKRDYARTLLEDRVKAGVLKKRRAYLAEYNSTCVLYSPNESV